MPQFKKPGATDAELAKHARQLAKAFNVQMVETVIHQPHGCPGEGWCMVPPQGQRHAQEAYAIAMHELGHCASPLGSVRRGQQEEKDVGKMRLEEKAAWDWAEQYALDWTPDMAGVRRTAESTYHENLPVELGGQPPKPAKPMRFGGLGSIARRWR